MTVAPRRSSHADPAIAELMRDTQRLASAPSVVFVGPLELDTDGSGALRETRIAVPLRRVLGLSIAHIRERIDARAVPAAGAPRWDGGAGEVTLYGIGGLSVSTRYLVTLRAEGEAR